MSSDEQLLAIASAFVLDEYAKPGERTYYWEEADDPHDDTTAHTVSSYAPPDSGRYSWAEITSCEILGVEILDRSDEGVMVEVRAAIAFKSGDQDEGEDYSPAAEERLISCWLEQDSNGEWHVENAEE